MKRRSFILSLVVFAFIFASCKSETYTMYKLLLDGNGATGDFTKEIYYCVDDEAWYRDVDRTDSIDRLDQSELPKNEWSVSFNPNVGPLANAGITVPHSISTQLDFKGYKYGTKTYVDSTGLLKDKLTGNTGASATWENEVVSSDGSMSVDISGVTAWHPGYKFLGWTFPGSDSVLYQSVQITGNTELVAKWQKEGIHKLILHAPDSTDGNHEQIYYYSEGDESFYREATAVNKEDRAKKPEKKYTVVFSSANAKVESPIGQTYKYHFDGYKDGNNLAYTNSEAIFNPNKDAKDMLEKAVSDAVEAYVVWNETNPPNPLTLKSLSLSGFTFHGWYDANDDQKTILGIKQNDGTWQYTPSKNMSLVALWTENTIRTLTLDDNGGSGGSKEIYFREDDDWFSDKNTKEGKYATSVKKPIKSMRLNFDSNTNVLQTDESYVASPLSKDADYTFLGYFIGSEQYVDESCSVMRNKSINSDVTATASWGNASSISLPTLSRKNYIFLGWSKNANSTTAEYNGSTQYTPTSDGETLYAIWKDNSVWRLTLSTSSDSEVTNSGTPSIYYSVSTKKWYFDAEMSREVTADGIVKPEKKVYVTFSSNMDGLKSPASVSSLKAFKGYPEYIDDAGKLINGVTLSENKTVTAVFDTVYSESTLQEMQATGYTFGGWSENGQAPSVGTVQSDKSYKYTPTGNILLKGIWTSDGVHTLTLNSDGTTPGSTNVYYQESSKKWFNETACTTEITSIEIPKREWTVNFDANNSDYVGTIASATSKWVFNGYGTYVDSNGMLKGTLTAPLTLTASWKEQSPATLPTITLNHYTFLGWMDNDKLYSIKENKSFMPKSDNVTLKASWDSAVYTLTLDSSDATYISVNTLYYKAPNISTNQEGLWYLDSTLKQALTIDSKTSKQTITLPKKEWVVSFNTLKSGADKVDPLTSVWTFGGYTYQDGSTSKTIINTDGTFASGITEDVTAVVVWNDDSGKRAITLPTSALSGYNLLGWREEGKTNTLTGSYTPTTALTTLNGVWESTDYYSLYLDCDNATNNVETPSQYDKTIYYKVSTGKWYSDTTFNTEITNAFSYLPNKNWKIDFVTDNGTTIDTKYSSWQFDGFVWNTGSILSTGVIAPNSTLKENLTVKTVWKIQTSLVLSTLPTLTKDGYNFEGWALLDDDGNVISDILQDLYIPSKNGTYLKAIWTPKVYTLTFESSDATDIPLKALYYKVDDGWYREKDASGTPITFITDDDIPEKVWTVNFKSNLAGVPNSMGTSKFIFTKYIGPNNNDYIIKSQNEGEWTILGSLTDNITATAEFDSNAMSQESTPLPILKKEGYTFDGWKVEGDDKFVLGDYRPLSNNTTLVGVWVDKQMIPATFDSYYDPIYDYLYDDNEKTVYRVMLVKNANLDKNKLYAIPATYDDGEHGRWNVRVINKEAFLNCTSLSYIRVPSTIRSCGSDIFSGCTSLNNVVLPDDAFLDYTKTETNLALALYKGNFNGCTSLKHVTLPKNATIIPNSTFNGCSALETLTIPSKVAAIGSNAFKGCTSLTDLCFAGTVSEWNQIALDKTWRVNSKIYKVTCTDNVVYFSYPVTLDNSSATSFETSTLMYDVASKMYYDGYNNTQVTTITLPKKEYRVHFISDHYVVSDDNVYSAFTFKGYKNGDTTYIDEAGNLLGSRVITAPLTITPTFDNQKGITLLTKATDGYVFHGWKKKDENGEYIGDFIEDETTIGTYVPAGDEELYAVWAISQAFEKFDKEQNKLVSSLTWSFDDTKKTYTITKADNNYIHQRYNYTIPSTYDDGIHGRHKVTGIAANAFEGCTNLSYLILPEGFTTIGKEAFKGCINLADIEFPHTIAVLEGDLFKDCTMLVQRLHYNGTKNEWKALVGKIISGNNNGANIDWNKGDMVATLVCTDGKVSYIFESVAFTMEDGEWPLNANGTKITGNSTFMNNTQKLVGTDISPLKGAKNIMLGYYDSVPQSNGVIDYGSREATGVYVKISLKVKEIGKNGAISLVYPKRADFTDEIQVGADLTDYLVPSSIMVDGKVIVKDVIKKDEILSDTGVVLQERERSLVLLLTGALCENLQTSVRDMATSASFVFPQNFIKDKETSKGNSDYSIHLKYRVQDEVKLYSGAKFEANDSGTVVGDKLGLSTLPLVIPEPGLLCSQYDRDVAMNVALMNQNNYASFKYKEDTTLQSFVNPYANVNGNIGLTKNAVYYPNTSTSNQKYAFTPNTIINIYEAPKFTTTLDSTPFLTTLNTTKKSGTYGPYDDHTNPFYADDMYWTIPYSSVMNSAPSVQSDEAARWAVFYTLTVPPITYAYNESTQSYAVNGFRSDVNIGQVANMTLLGQVDDGVHGVKNVTSFATGMFENCPVKNSIQTLTIPGQITSLSDYCFQGLSNLTTCTLGTGVVSIGANAFVGTKLASIEIPSSLTTVGENAFYTTTLKTVTFQNGITTLPNNIFKGIPELETVVLPNTITRLGTGVFQNCAKLKNVTLPINASFTSIPDYTFYGCTALTSITIPNSVTSIGEYAFKGAGLTSVTMSASLQTIKQYAFTNCNALTSIAFPSTLTTLGQFAFYGCGSLTNVINNANNLTVIPIGAFTNCTHLSSIDLSHVVTLQDGSEAYYYKSGSNGAFQNTALTSINLSSCVNIGDSSFEDCTSLQSTDTNPISMPVIRAIGTNAFRNCNNTNFKKIVFPSTLTTLNSAAFYSCTSLETVDNTNANLLKVIPVACFMNTKLSSFDFSRIETVQGVKNLNYDPYRFGSFTNTRFTSLNLSSVTTIGCGAFKGCTSLQSVVMSTSDTSLDSYAFYGCSSLQSIDLTHCGYDSVSGSSHTYYAVREYCFTGCTSLRSVTLPTRSGYNIMDSFAFSGCSSLSLITFPSNITKLYSCAFSGCAFTTLTLPPTIDCLVDRTFINCTSLKTVTWERPSSIDNLYVTDHIFSGTSNLVITFNGTRQEWGNIASKNLGLLSGATNVSVLCKKNEDGTDIPDEQLNDPNGVFEWNASNQNFTLKSIPVNTSPSYTIPATHTDASGHTGPVVAIASGALSSTSGLTSVIFTLPSNVTSIGDKAFVGTALTNITLPSSVTSVGNEVFKGITTLRTVQFDSTSAITIGNSVFSGCKLLTTVTLPSVVSSIGTNMFSNCNSLKMVTLPTSGMTSIPAEMFYKCSSLDTMTLPSTITTIGAFAFYDCQKLPISTSFIAHLTSIGNQAFYNCKGLNGTINLSSITANSSLGSYAFSQCSSITGVNFSTNSGFTTIPIFCFQACTSLTGIETPNNITVIQYGAFSGCTSLSWIKLNGITTIASSSYDSTNYVSYSFYGAFYNCPLNDTTRDPAYGSVYMPKIQTIGAFAFYGSLFTSLTLPSTCTNIYTSAFAMNTHLQSFSFGSSTVATITYHLFQGCSALNTVSNTSNIKNIYHDAFSGCTALQTLSFENVTMIYSNRQNDNKGVFYDAGLKTITLPKLQTVSGDGVFAGVGLETINDGVTTERYCFNLKELASLGSYMCYNTNNVRVVRAPKATSISPYAFRSCTSLTDVYVSTTLTSISQNAFMDCPAITTIHYQGTRAQWNNVSKTSGWKNNCPLLQTVMCTDGNIMVVN